MITEQNALSWVDKATPWSPETEFIAGHLLRENAILEKRVEELERLNMALRRRLLEK